MNKEQVESISSHVLRLSSLEAIIQTPTAASGDGSLFPLSCGQHKWFVPFTIFLSTFVEDITSFVRRFDGLTQQVVSRLG